MPTAHAECTFVVKEGGADRPFIVVEPTVAGVDVLDDVQGFVLVAGRR